MKEKLHDAVSLTALPEIFVAGIELQEFGPGGLGCGVNK
jgi:hypothetical protein